MMTVRAVEKGTGRVRTGRIGGGSGSGGVSPAFQADFTGLTSLPSWMSFSRASNGMVTDNTGKLTYAPNNLLTQSNTFSDTVWTKTNITVSNANAVSDPVGGTNASTVTATANSAQILYTAAGAIPAALAAINSIWIKRRTGSGTIQIYQPGATPQTVTVTGAWQQFYTWSAPSGGGTVYLGLILATSGDAVDVYFGTLSAVTYETTPRSLDQVITTSSPYYGPRSDFAWNGSAWVAIGLLIEEQRTNTFINSNNLAGSGWTNTTTVTVNFAVSPDGTTNANRIQISGAGVYSYQSTTQTNTPYTSSVWARSNTGSNQSFRLFGATLASVSPDKVATSVWQRFSFTFTPPAGDNLSGIEADAAGDAADIQVYGFQLEAGTFATSYIPTTTAAVTRSADIAQLTGAALAAAIASTGTIIAQVGQVGSSSGRIIGTDLSHTPLFVFDNATVKAYDGLTGFVASATLPGGNTFQGNSNRVAVGWDATPGESLVADGGTANVGTLALYGAGGVSSVFLGSLGGTSSFANTHFESLAIYSSRLSNADLQAKSVVGASF